MFCLVPQSATANIVRAGPPEVERTPRDAGAAANSEPLKKKKRKEPAAPDQAVVTDTLMADGQENTEAPDWITVRVAWSNFVRQLDEFHGLMSSVTKVAYSTLRLSESK